MIFVYHGFSTGIPFSILIIYGKDPNFKDWASKFYYPLLLIFCNENVMTFLNCENKGKKGKNMTGFSVTLTFI